MKTRTCLLVGMLLLALSMQAQTYDQLWKDVEQMERKDLPQSIIAQAKMIYAKAKAERNVPQMMKAYLTMMACRGDISPDSIAVDVKGLEAWAEEPATQMQDKAVLYSILGGICIREDFEKGNRFLHLSLKDSLTLINYSAEKLVPIVKTEPTSRLYFHNNLYDLLARRAIQLWEQNQWNSRQEETRSIIQRTYQSLLHIYKVKGMHAAWLLTALDAHPQADEKQLRAWINEYGNLDVCAEVYLRLAQWMLREDNPPERLAVLREGINRYPHYNRINALKNEEREILSPRLNFSIDYTYPDESIQARVNHRNLQAFTVRIYRINLPAESALLSKLNPKNVGDYGTCIEQEHVQLPPTPDYRERTDTIKLQPLKAGIYYLVTTPDGHRDIKQGALMQVSALQVIHRALPEGKQELVVLDKRSGHPVAGARVRIYEKNQGDYLLKESHPANAEGVVMMKKEKNRYAYLQACTATDTSMPITQVWLGNEHYEASVKTEEHIRLFTDRALYRPGQTLHFSGMVYSQRKDWTKVKEGATYSIALMDADGREVATKEVKTDTFGTFQGTFELPKSGKLGVFRLQADKGMTTFRVEEYKRPTFEVTFDTVRTNYRAGDSIRVTGVARTFAGAPVQGAKVNYAIVRLENNFWRMRGVETNRVMGETVTDAQGRFEVPLHFLPIKADVHRWYYTYEVMADVTSLAGETQTGTLDLPLGSSSLRLFIPDWEGTTLVKEIPRDLVFRVSNLMDKLIAEKVCYQVFSQGKQVLQGEAMSNDAFVPKDIYALPSGHYQLKAKVTDERGQVSEQMVAFSILSIKDGHLPEGTGVWCYQSSDEFADDGTATIYWGSSDKDVYLFYDVMSGDNRLKQERIMFSDSLMTFRYTYREEYGDGLRCNFTYLKHGELHTRNFYIKKPKPDKALQLKWKTFRDKLKPGQQETWTLSILGPEGRPADAQLMATMYDASLDRLASHDWRFDLTFTRSLPPIFWRQVAGRGVYEGLLFPLDLLKYPSLAYSVLDIPAGLGMERRGLRMYKAAARVEGVRNAMTLNDEVAMEMQVEEQSMEEDVKDVQLRTDFAETAFFYPQLRTNADGEVNIEFTLPESLTEWKFMGLAHTQNMDYGSMTANAIASKEFMLQSSLPRFVRVGDKVNVAASLMNLSAKQVQGVVRMELLVPDTEKVILSRKTPFTVKAGETGKVSFSFDVTDEYMGLVVRMVADGDSFSDGEQSYLPVLSNKQKLTESVLLNVNGAGAYTFSLESLFNEHSKTVSHPRMWVEFTGNPIWYAIQALKVVASPENDNSLSWASAYYANALLAHLVKAEPDIADSLKVDGLDARLWEATAKLKELQQEDGSWSWFKGMNGSLHMTTSIAQLLARLQRMTGDVLPEDVQAMYRKAHAYLNRQASEDVKRMKEQEKNGAQEVKPSEWLLQYLYILAIGDEANLQSEEAHYLVKKLEGMSSELTIYGKALGSIILHRFGRIDKAREFLQSMMQYSVMTEEMGRYFDTGKASYSWLSYKIPTQVAAIEAVRWVANEEKTLMEMKQWLLKQKQAQAWETPIATTDAVYALLATSDWKPHTGKGKIIICEGKKNKREGEIRFGDDGAMGYICQEIQGRVMDVRKIIVEKESAGIGWGAVYAEFEETMEQVSAYGNALHIHRTLYKDDELLATPALLEVGDRLTVRLTIIADRDMDFVQVKDARAACMEPVDVLSGYRWDGRVGYYLEVKDAATTFYLEKMPKGTHVLEYEVHVTSSGKYGLGVPVVKSSYAPEFSGHGNSDSLLVK